jgi:hypothetical protein
MIRVFLSHVLNSTEICYHIPWFMQQRLIIYTRNDIVMNNLEKIEKESAVA